MENKTDWSGLEDRQKELEFSGSIHVKSGEIILFSDAYGFADISHRIMNQPETRFSIASGSKIFTAAAICMLIEEGKLDFDTRFTDCLDVEFPNFDEGVTIHQLLTHTSGVPDYFDEDEMDDYEALWEQRPMYNVRSPGDFLPMFQYEKMDDASGISFKYNNAGYIILGLVIEKISGMAFTEYIEKNLFQRAGMFDSGYFTADELPGKTAAGYIEKNAGGWKTNIFSMPAKGGPDGGAYVTAGEFSLFWESMRDGKILSDEMKREFLKPRVNVAEDIGYGYAGYMEMSGESVVKYIQMGYDPGVNFRAVYYPDEDYTMVICSNRSEGAYEMLKEAEHLLLDE